MRQQIIIWTALPSRLVGGETDRRAQLSVHVSPRLKTDEGATLALFPDWLDWPAHLQPGRVSFTVQVGDTGPPVPATILSPSPDRALWQALFGPSSLLRSHEGEDLTGRPVAT